jgi:signal transduction histidine kinase
MCAVVAAAAGLAILFTRITLHAPGEHLLELAAILLATGVAGVLGSIAIARWTRRLPFSAKAVIASALALLVLSTNVLVASWRMFISSHDLDLLLILVGYALVVTLGPAMVIGRALNRRLLAIEAVTGRLGEGDLTARVETGDAHDELSRVATAVNTLAARLELAEEERRQLEDARRYLFVAVSHDLRTPLAAIQAMVEALQDDVVSDAETRARYLGNISGEIRRLSLLIGDLFELTRLESGELRLDLEEVRLDRLIEEAVDSLRPQAERAGVRLEWDGEVRERILADPARLTRALYNLVQNAIRHTPPDGTITVRAASLADGVQVAVADTGEGIDPADLPLLFDRFYRGERSRAREYGGAGLGLAIVRSIVEAHRGRVWAENGQRGGAVFTLVLPAAPA